MLERKISHFTPEFLEVNAAISQHALLKNWPVLFLNFVSYQSFGQGLAEIG
jgi:hypothetical protein